MSRFLFANGLLGLLILSPAASGLAAQLVPVRPVSAQSRVLERLIGTWDTQITGGSADSSDKPIAIGRITRQWVADHKFVQELGGEHEAFITYESSRRTYHAWYFHSNGHVWDMSGRWTGSSGALSFSASLDQSQSLTRQFQFQDDKRHECQILWTDENGRTGIYGTLNFTRCDPAAAENSGKNSKTPPKAKSPPPAEMKIFADEIGKWAIESTMTRGGNTTKAAASSVVALILGGQFLQTTTTIAGREGESIEIAGFDAATKTYRCWRFDADAVSSGPATGTWDEKERTMTWQDKREGDIMAVSKRQSIDRDTAKVHTVSSRQAGTVDFTTDSTLTRQKDK
jgi:hypothetical protein